MGMGMCHTWECSGSVHVGSHCSYYDLAPRRHGLWPMGMRKWKRRAYCCKSWWRARWWNCIRRFVAENRRGGRAVLPGYLVLGGLISFEIWTHLSLYFFVVFVRVWGHLKVGLCMDSSPRKRCVLARHLLIAHTVQVWRHVSQSISGVSIAQVSMMQTNPSIDSSGADYGVFVSFHWLSFPRFLKLWRLKQ